MSPRLLLAVATCLVVAGCGGVPRASVAFAVSAPLPPTYLRYHVRSTRGDWTREFVVGPGSFAELRQVGGKSYALGLAGSRAWMRVGERPPVEIDGALAADERTEEAWVGMRFGQSEGGGAPELEGCHGGRGGKPSVCTFVYTPTDGHALWVDADRGTGRPVGFSRIAQHDAVEACQDLTWSDVDGALAIASATCSAIVNEVGRDTQTWSLEERHPVDEPPAWARVDEADVLPLAPLRDPVVVPIADPSSRVYVDAVAGGSAPLQLVLDTGSPVTVLSRRALAALGVVPSPEPPLHVHPPFLPQGTYDAVIVDRLQVGELDVHGARVLVPRDDAPFDGQEAGLLGMDVLAHYVLDVDGPESTLRIWPRDRFEAGDEFAVLPFWGASHGAVVVGGAVPEIGPMPLILDTGAPLDVVVGGPTMHAKHPHHQDDEVMLREDEDRSDYMTEVNGLELGPFALPKMPAVGHDRRPDLSFLDCDSALVGLGVLRHFRLVVDAAKSQVLLAPGPSYAVLSRLGVEIDTRAGKPTVTRIVEGEHDWSKPLREGDVVWSVDGVRTHDRDEALVALADAGATVRVTLVRNGNRVTRRLRLR